MFILEYLNSIQYLIRSKNLCRHYIFFIIIFLFLYKNYFEIIILINFKLIIIVKKH